MGLKDPQKEKQKNNLSRSALRRQREREHRYQTILRAAEALISTDGYHSASIEQIADKAEVSVGTVYFYFKNKEDLLVQLLDEIGYQLRSILGREFRKEDSSMAGIRNAGRVFFEEFCRLHPGRVAIIFRESVGQGVRVEEHRKQIFHKLISDVRKALVRIGEAQDIEYQSRLSAEVMAVSIMGTFERIAYHYLIWQNRPHELETIGPDVIDFIVGGINNLCQNNSREGNEP